jgi:hypothetical protein
MDQLRCEICDAPAVCRSYGQAGLVVVWVCPSGHGVVCKDTSRRLQV